MKLFDYGVVIVCVILVAFALYILHLALEEKIKCLESKCDVGEPIMTDHGCVCVSRPK